MILFVGLTPCDEDKTNPVVWGDYTYKNDDIRRFDGIIQEVCQSRSVGHVSVFDAMAGRIKELFPDGLHPNNEGHERMAGLIKPELDKLLV